MALMQLILKEHLDTGRNAIAERIGDIYLCRGR